MRNHYWTCSAFADWLRGTMKPSAETSDGWRKWRNQAQKDHPVRYWVAEEGLDILQKIVYYIPDFLYSIKYYINNRFITRTHALTAHSRDIKPGEWCDVGYRFLPCMFNELVDFVEVELAWWHLAWEGKEQREKYKMPWWAVGWWRVRTWRCPQAGLDNLAWQMNLTNKDWASEDNPEYSKPSLQAINAREIHELYKWWTEQRPQRPDPYKVSGWSDYCDSKRRKSDDIFDDLENDDKIDTKPMLDHIHKLEEDYEREDEEMMIRLIKIRRALWT
jgi:hypothetical protein